jgi:hypothetical protein
MGSPLIERRALLEPLVANKLGLQFSGHEAGDGELILTQCPKVHMLSPSHPRVLK